MISKPQGLNRTDFALTPSLIWIFSPINKASCSEIGDPGFRQGWDFTTWEHGIVLWSRLRISWGCFVARAGCDSRSTVSSGYRSGRAVLSSCVSVKWVQNIALMAPFHFWVSKARLEEEVDLFLLAMRAERAVPSPLHLLPFLSLCSVGSWHSFRCLEWDPITTAKDLSAPESVNSFCASVREAVWRNVKRFLSRFFFYLVFENDVSDGSSGFWKGCIVNNNGQVWTSVWSFRTW